jgi:hypothetical protein
MAKYNEKRKPHPNPPPRGGLKKCPIQPLQGGEEKLKEKILIEI